jgi:hypothetical protein
MGSYFYKYDEPETILQVNSFAISNKKMEYVIEVYDNDDDEPSLNMYRFMNNRVKYNH